MLHGLVRSPVSYFDITQSGQLTNKFSNDLGFMDYMFAYIFIDSFEGPIISLILLGNVFFINAYYSIPGGLNIVLLVIFFLYCKKVVVTVKQLDLKAKSPVYNMIN